MNPRICSVAVVLAFACKRNVPVEGGSRYRFDWSPPCTVPAVEMRAGDAGPTIEVAYQVHLDRSGNGLVVYRDASTAKTIGGAPVMGTRSAAEQRSIAGLIELPRFEVATTGEFRAMGDYEPYAALMVQVFVDDKGEGARTYAQQSMASPEMRAMADEQLRAMWQAWVQAWIGWPVAAGTRRERDGVVLEHLGTRDGRAHLKYTESREGSTPITMEVETDVATLRPMWARREDRFGKREVRFDWTHAVGCKK